MRTIRTAVLAGAAAIAAAGAATAASNDTHYLNIALPDGAVAHIAYKGDVPPNVTVVPPQTARLPTAFVNPLAATPFAILDRIAEEMHRQFGRLMQDAGGMGPGQSKSLDLVSFGSLPAGTVRYSFVSTTNGKQTCTRSMQVTAQGGEQPPKVVSASSGDCPADNPFRLPGVGRKGSPGPAPSGSLPAKGSELPLGSTSTI